MNADETIETIRQAISSIPNPGEMSDEQLDLQNVRYLRRQILSEICSHQKISPFKAILTLKPMNRPCINSGALIQRIHYLCFCSNSPDFLKIINREHGAQACRNRIYDIEKIWIALMHKLAGCTNYELSRAVGHSSATIMRIIRDDINVSEYEPMLHLSDFITGKHDNQIGLAVNGIGFLTIPTLSGVS